MSNKRAIVEHVNNRIKAHARHAQQGCLIILAVSAVFTLFFYIISSNIFTIICGLATLLFAAIVFNSFRDVKRCHQYVVLIYGQDITLLTELEKRTQDTKHRVRSTIKTIISLSGLDEMYIDDITGSVVPANIVLGKGKSKEKSAVAEK
ncbi:MAG: hypothetical protein FWB93_06510 [Oscillospiraceae bacterium]|nr:hypothetical protein [Oscillospiraceae bacterium]